MARAATTWTNRTGVAARLLEAVLPLPVTIESIATSQLSLGGATSFTRTTTIVELAGGGHVGRGEDVAYSGDTQATLPAAYARRDDLVGEWTIGSLAAHLDERPLVPAGGESMDDKPGFHRWALESAALDLGLRQADADLASIAGVEWHPLRTSLSMGLGSPPSADVVRRWLDRDPSISFKLDVNQEWDRELVAELASYDRAVSSIDFKGLYSGPWIDNDYSPALYLAVADGLPEALLEDVKLNAEVLDALDEDALRRLAWDYPITRPEDVPGLAGSTSRFSDLRPGAVNIKPSRFGSLERLLATIMRCDDEGIPCYSGGQFELGVGRTQVQSITSLCFPDGPNDCAPVMYHSATPDSDDVPLGPVRVPSDRIGFGWDAPTRATSAEVDREH